MTIQFMDPESSGPDAQQYGDGRRLCRRGVVLRQCARNLMDFMYYFIMISKKHMLILYNTNG
jgi:hypothetical protein